MKISKALSEKKAAQNALSRLIVMRNRNLYYDKSKGPELEFDEIEKEIEARIARIDELKMRIAYTNCHTTLASGKLLQEAIVKLGNIRSELKCYNELLEKEPADRLVYYGGKVQVREYVAQANKKYIMKRIEELEAEKYQLDALIAKANNTTELLEIPE
jgi:prefoldin subunit 5